MMLKKIALTINNLSIFGGAERVVAILSKELAKKYTVDIIRIFNNNDSAYMLDPKIKVNNLYNNKHRLREIFFGGILRIKKYIRENSIEVLIIVDRPNAIIPLMVKFITGVNIVF
ncbi:MAG: hypothetical protein LIO65_02325, partial [Odoribacter sp.]|nr:hypothetical protein [Odoribacter sp.]